MNIRDLLKKELSVARPSRYAMNDRGWIDEVADSIDLDQVDVSTEEAIRVYVRNIARDVEGKATKAGNQLMRQYHQESALPIEWMQMVNEPIALENKVVVDDRIQTVKERVRLRDATARDFELWAETEDAARRRDYDARGEAVSGALEIASQMRAAGALTFWQWAKSADEKHAA